MRRITISDMRDVAARRNGKCLSETYVNANTKLSWQCVSGHKWLATPRSVKQGTWCPYCAGKHRTIDDMRKVAAKRGGKCISDEYVGANSTLLWECAKGHRWEAIANSVWRGTWCPYCAGKRKTIEDMRKLAKGRGGQCLSDAYVSDRANLLWECVEGHRWHASPNNIIRGTWCPYCAGKHKTIEDMRELAQSRGGKCLSRSYMGDKTKLLWECEEGHTWQAVPGSIAQGTWCPYCAGKHKTIEDMRELAQSRGGKCVSNRYLNANTKLLWECANGHRWKAAPGSVQHGTWCPYCAGKHKTIDHLRGVAKRRGGMCLSQNYRGMRRKHLWECAEGHQWEAVPYSIDKGHWCPQCSSGLGERICREFFEQLFGAAFPKGRPEWLIGEYGTPMELDGYCEPLGLAFEHQGEHHYSTDAHYVREKAQLEETQERDRLKNAICNRHGIILIAVPEIPERLPLSEIKSFIKKECERKHFPLPHTYDEITPDLQKAYMTNGAREALRELGSIASAKGGRCLSDVYINNTTLMLWECADGHQWRARSNNIKQGTWCPFCAGIKKTAEETRKLVKDMRMIATQRGGKCLGGGFSTLNARVLWECNKGHRWYATPGSIRRGTWCPKCAGKAKKTIDEMRQLASDHGGRCLSDSYVNVKTNLFWECAEGHQWEAPAGRVLNGAWCPYCAGVVKKTIDDMHELATQRKGKCLSSAYVNTETKLLWECAEGHRWEAKPAHVKRGSWCPYCAGVIKKTIDDMRRLTQNRGGRCLSSRYINAKTKLLWECAEGHQWEAVPSSIQQGTWCPTCAKLAGKN